jgi:hypothetical protein
MSAVPYWLSRWKVTSTWLAHILRGSAGGIDYGAPVGTAILAASDGVVDYRVLSDGSSVARVTRPDGTATEMLHGRPVGKRRTVKHLETIATSDGRRGVWGSGRSSGAHIHAHDVDTRGRRVRPFSTVPSGGTGGGGITLPTISKDITMRILFNKDAPASADATRRAIIGELSFQVITGPQSKRERKFWGDPVNVTVGEWNAARDLVIARRKELGLPVMVAPNGSVPAGVALKADVDAAADRVIGEVAQVPPLTVAEMKKPGN